VDELRALRRGAGREVVPFDEGGSQAPCRGVQSDADAGDPAADDEDVELLLLEPAEHRAAIEGRRLAHGEDECRRTPFPALCISAHGLLVRTRCR
jgi:hypothetical protein